MRAKRPRVLGRPQSFAKGGFEQLLDTELAKKITALSAALLNTLNQSDPNSGKREGLVRAYLDKVNELIVEESDEPFVTNAIRGTRQFLGVISDVYRVSRVGGEPIKSWLITKKQWASGD
jgi:hypothetical protein